MIIQMRGMKNTKQQYFNLIRIKSIVGYISIVFGLLSVAFFLASLVYTESWILFGHVIADEVPGSYGDYVGGFVGTVLTV